MNIEEALQNAKLEALQADPEMTICLVITVGEGTDLTKELSNEIYESVAASLLGSKWADIPIFVVPEGTKIEAVMVPKQEGNVDKPTAQKEEIELSLSYNPGGRDEALSVAAVFKYHLERTNLWNLIPDWLVSVVQLDNGWSIGLRTANVEAPDIGFNNTHFNVNIIGRTFYLLDIELVKHLRGRGYGSELYTTLEEIAKDLKCTRIEQTSSGYVQLTGEHRKKAVESRAEWLQRRGWQLTGAIAYKNL